MILSSELQQAICNAADCKSILGIESFQSLWAGQGQICRIQLESENGKPQSLVMKQVSFESTAEHPRGWNTQLSQMRKRKSYHVELEWYRHAAADRAQINPLAPLPALIYVSESERGMAMVMEDLAENFPVRFTGGKSDRPTTTQIRSCIKWLAQFHGQHLGKTPTQFWSVGGYWHLDTRPDELDAMPEGALKQAASDIDHVLRHNPYQTIIHGDAKLANFCFCDRGENVAAVDFQYVGGGPGVKDLMMLLSSVMPDERLISDAAPLVDFYFECLTDALAQWQPQTDAADVVAAWRPLYAVAWADFYRFLEGWSPGHWKAGQYCQQQTELALAYIARQSQV